MALASKNDECREFAQFLKSKIPAADKESSQQLNAQPTNVQQSNSTGKDCIFFYFLFLLLSSIKLRPIKPYNLPY